MVWAAIAQYAIPAVLGYMGQRSANKTNIELASENREFQAAQAATSWQRGVEDLQAAGLNPMLAYQQGGAQSPTSQAARVEDEISPAVASALQAAQIKSTLQQVEANEAAVDKLRAEIAQIQSMTFDHNLNSAIRWQEWKQLETGNWRNDILGRTDFQRLVREKMLLEAEQTGKNPGYPNSAFAADVAKRKAESELANLKIPREKAEAQFYSGAMGALAPAIDKLLKWLSPLGDIKVQLPKGQRLPR